MWYHDLDMLCDDLAICVLFEVVCLKASNQSSEWNTQFLKPCASAPWHPPTTVVGMLVNNPSTSITCQDSSCMFYQISFLIYHLLIYVIYHSSSSKPVLKHHPSHPSKSTLKQLSHRPAKKHSTCTRPFSIVPKPTPSRRYKKMPTWLTQLQEVMINTKPPRSGVFGCLFFWSRSYPNPWAMGILVS